MDVETTGTISPEEKAEPLPSGAVKPETPVRALLIHSAFCGPNEAGGTRHYELGRRMVSRSHKLTVITSTVSYLTGLSVGNGRRELMDGVEVRRAYTYKPADPNFLQRIVSMLSFATTSIFAALRCETPQVVMGTTPPIFQAASAGAIAFLRRRPLLLEIRDLWPDFAIDMGVLKNPVLIGLSRWLERTLYRRAAHLVVNSPAYRDALIAKGVAPGKISFISNGVDISMFDPAARGQHIRQQFKLGDKFVITYAGALGVANDIGTVLRAAERLQPDEPGVHFLIVGDGKERTRLQEKAKSMGLSNITFAGAQPKNRIAEFLAASDACLAVLQDIPMFRTTYPNKVFDYMAAGRPTILAIDGVIRDVVEQAQGGICVPPGDDLAIADAARKLSGDPALLKKMGASARAYVAQYFNRDDQAQAFVDLVVRVARSGNENVLGARANMIEPG